MEEETRRWPLVGQFVVLAALVFLSGDAPVAEDVSPAPAAPVSWVE